MQATTTNPEPTVNPASPRPHRVRAATLGVLQVLTAAGFLASAAGKLAGSARIEAVFTAMGAGHGLMYTVAALEVAGAVGLFVPWLRGPAAVGLVALMVGAITTHLLVGGSPAMAAVMLLLSAAVAVGRRHETMQLASRATAYARPRVR